MRPFLKWAGGKFLLVSKLKRILPEGRRLIEPFVGSAALFLNTDYPDYVLSDVNADLINTYHQLKEGQEYFIEYCAQWFHQRYNTQEAYHALRQHFNQSKDSVEKAALFLYLNRHGYNGLCRYNQQGAYNVPFGRGRSPYFPMERMRFFYKKAQLATFVCQDFRKTLRYPRKGDVFYCDPPYLSEKKRAFTEYHSIIFTPKDHEALADRASDLALKGVHVLISNHDTPMARLLYKQAELHHAFMPRWISCLGNQRSAQKELIALFSKHEG